MALHSKEYRSLIQVHAMRQTIHVHVHDFMYHNVFDHQLICPKINDRNEFLLRQVEDDICANRHYKFKIEV